MSMKNININIHDEWKHLVTEEDIRYWTLSWKDNSSIEESKEVFSEDNKRTHEYEEDMEAAKHRIYWRLMCWRLDEPDVLESAVGSTMGNEDHMGTTNFMRGIVNRDIRGQGFWCEPSPGACAQWMHGYKGDVHEGHGGYAFGIFPVIGELHNYKYFESHPMVYCDFGIADGLIIDRMQIVGEPCYVWMPKHIEQDAEGDRDFRRYTLSNTLTKLFKGGADYYTMSNDEKVQLIVKAEISSKVDIMRIRRMIADGIWEEAYEKYGDGLMCKEAVPTTENKEFIDIMLYDIEGLMEDIIITVGNEDDDWDD